jgi:predicted regulator of Ras-like GTPase activity (Roadblock/LC7/MglB family)
MYEILEELNKTAGVTGSMIVGQDGIVIAADLTTQLQDEAVGVGILAVTTDPQVNVGLIRLEVKNAAQKVRSAQKSTSGAQK